jgi:hypothetical protein
MGPFFIKTGQGIKYPNKYYLIDEHTVQIEVSDKSGNKYYSFIDREDFDKVSFCNWKIRKDSFTFYLCNSLHGFMHRIISNCPDELTVDHIDGNGLNNRKSNLRNVTIGENSLNKRHMKMIYFDQIQQRYRVYWRQDGKQKSKSFYVSEYGDNAKLKAEEFKEYIVKEVYKRPEVSFNTT